jgi:hypothetical protein
MAFAVRQCDLMARHFSRISFFLKRMSAAAPDSRSRDMELRLLMALASAAFFLAPTHAGALNSAQDDAAPGRAFMQNANESAQATTDVWLGEAAQATMPLAQAMQNVAYGGVAAGTAQAGGPQERPCSSGLHCRIYFGR